MNRAREGNSGGEMSGFDVRTLLAAQPQELTDGEVLDGMVDLVTHIGQAQAMLARMTATFDTRALASVDGARSTAGWLAARTELPRSAAANLVLAGRRLRHCPVVDAAARDGQLGEAKVQMLLDARVDLEDLFAEHEAVIVAEVAPLTVAQASVVIKQWRQIALATVGNDDGPEPGDDSTGNEVHLSPAFQNRWRLDGDLDEQTGEGMANALDAWIDRQIRSGVVDPTNRSRSSLRAEALGALVGVGAVSDAPRTQPHASVRFSWDAADLLGRPVASMAELAHRRCLTERGSVLSRSVAEMALCNADITDLLVAFGLDGSRTILGATHTRRHATDHERAALAERDRGCVFPGCDAPIGWCDAHHTIPYEVGHRTRLDELVLLCPHHHRQVHRGFTLTRSGTGHIHVARPDGTRLSPEPPGGETRVDPRRKLPPPVTRFTATFGSARAAADESAEPFEPGYEARIEARIRRRWDELMPGAA
ncbi:MAG: hypothetical protein ABI239_09670 [Aquihabitans sp.]